MCEFPPRPRHVQLLRIRFRHVPLFLIRGPHLSLARPGTKFSSFRTVYDTPPLRFLERTLIYLPSFYPLCFCPLFLLVVGTEPLDSMSLFSPFLGNTPESETSTITGPLHWAEVGFASFSPPPLSPFRSLLIPDIPLLLQFFPLHGFAALSCGRVLPWIPHLCFLLEEWRVPLDKVNFPLILRPFSRFFVVTCPDQDGNQNPSLPLIEGKLSPLPHLKQPFSFVRLSSEFPSPNTNTGPFLLSLQSRGGLWLLLETLGQLVLGFVNIKTGRILL